MIKDFINIADFTGPQLKALLDRAIADKAMFRQDTLPQTLENRTLAMFFEKPSLRTRVSFETAMTHLGGHAMYLTPADIGLGQRESVADTGRVLSRMVDGIMARTFSHELVCELAKVSSIPVVNALTDYSHPCQAMADLMTLQEHRGELAGKTIVFVGDGNNVARSLAAATERLGMHFVLACPEGYELEPEFVDTLDADRFSMNHDPIDSVRNADVIYADTWVSMGQEEEKAQRVRDFDSFQVNADLMSEAPEEAFVLHCLPAYKGYEISEETFEAYAEYIFDQSENRLHFQRSLLNVLMDEGGIE
ncbi:MAG: ornithine carbamoyltransferase [Phycisphaerae bacterium]